jgi:hypothetical protein
MCVTIAILVDASRNKHVQQTNHHCPRLLEAQGQRSTFRVDMCIDAFRVS